MINRNGNLKAYPPGPKINLFKGHLITTRRVDPLKFMTTLAEQYGDIAHFRVGNQHYYFLNHPDFIKEVLTKHYGNFLKGKGRKPATQFLGDGVITADGDRHRRQRRLMQPDFHKERIASYGEAMVNHSVRLAERWRDGQTVDVAEEMRRLTLSIISETLFHADTEAEADELSKAVSATLRQFRSFRLPLTYFLEKLSLKRNRQYEHGTTRLDSTIYRMIRERRKNPNGHGDLLSGLLRARTEGSGEGMTDREVRDEAMSIFLAGYETTAIALTWTYYLLSQHPQVLAELEAEISRVLGSRRPTTDDVVNLKYTGMVVAEAMRLYPPSWRLVRRTINDFEIGGYVVPAQSQIVMSQYVMQRDERYYPDASRFDPQRWTPEAKAVRPQYSYFPFGGGTRRCIGEGFALMEAVLVIAALGQSWRLRLVPGHRVETQPTHILRPRYGMRMVLEHRRGNNANGGQSAGRLANLHARD